jgi:putative FmdB family regulatory protein
MPLYEYQCTQCGRVTEHLQNMNGPPLAACPNCGGEVKKLISAPAFQFKGTGWYVTDYAGKKGVDSSPSPGAGSASTSEAKASGESSASSGGETKAASGESKPAGTDPKPAKPVKSEA